MLNEIYTLLGQDTLLLAYAGQRCLLTSDELRTLTPAATRTAAYQRDLLAHDVGLPCGKVNAGRCALVVHDVSSIKPLLRLNPAFRTTAASDTPSGVVFWFRTSGYTPPSFRGKSLSWLADEELLLVRRASPADPGWSVLRAGQPLALKLWTLDLSLDPALAEHWSRHRMAHRFGGPFRATKGDGRSLNIEFCAAYATDLFRIRYHPGARFFDWVAPEADAPSIVAPELLARRIGDMIFAAMDTANPYRPTHADRMAVLRHIRILAAIEEMDAGAVIQAFVQECLAPQRQSALTTEELALACEQFCRARRLPILSRNVLLLRVGVLLGQRFGTRASNSIVRDGRPHRGFRAISLKIPQLLEAGAARDERDGGLGVKSEPPTEPAAMVSAQPEVPHPPLSVTRLGVAHSR